MGSDDSNVVSSATAVLLGAVTPGVNAPTWKTVKISFVLLGLCLALILGLGFSLSDSYLVLHVAVLLLLAATLFFLLSNFLAETGGLVSVEDQMREIGVL
ncbi:hypothetical protein M569_06461, partial [Genlisea aurea]